MSGYLRRGLILYDPITNAQVGTVDLNGNEQLGSGATIVSISGNAAIGGTLTATLAAGFSATGYQWMTANANGSNPVDVAGQTNATYVVRVGDARVLCRATGLAFTAGGISVPAPAPPPAPAPASTFPAGALLPDGQALLIDSNYLLVN